MCIQYPKHIPVFRQLCAWLFFVHSCSLSPVVFAGGGCVRAGVVIHRLILKICNFSVDESHKGCRAAPLFSAPVLAARRGSNAACGQYPASGRARDGRRFRSRRALSLLCARHSPSDERPSSRFRGIVLPPKKPGGCDIPRSA